MFRNVPECSGMFRDVPVCSGMFHVPGFIDGRSITNVIFFPVSSASVVVLLFPFCFVPLVLEPRFNLRSMGSKK